MSIKGGVNDWVILSKDGDLPSFIDVLLFHAGRGDPSGIPDDITFTKEFVFSGPGATLDDCNDRENVIPIRRPFTDAYCPVKKRHLFELVEFINKDRNEPPTFCLRERTASSLYAITILCQCYASVGMAAGQIKADNTLAEAIGWNSHNLNNFSHFKNQLSTFWPAIQGKEWWYISLGLISDDGISYNPTKFQEFLARLITDIELEDIVCNKLHVTDDSQLIGCDCDQLFNAVKSTKSPIGLAIVEFLNAPQVTTPMIENIYSQIKAFLE